jgi:hypothetical protein
MKWPVMDHVAALTKALEISQPIIGGIMIQVRSGQYNAGGASRNQRQQVRPARIFHVYKKGSFPAGGARTMPPSPAFLASPPEAGR